MFDVFFNIWCCFVIWVVSGVLDIFLARVCRRWFNVIGVGVACFVIFFGVVFVVFVGGVIVIVGFFCVDIFVGGVIVDFLMIGFFVLNFFVVLSRRASIFSSVVFVGKDFFLNNKCVFNVVLGVDIYDLKNLGDMMMMLLLYLRSGLR